MGRCGVYAPNWRSFRHNQVVLVFVSFLLITCDAANDTPVTNVGRIFSFLVPGMGTGHDNGPLLFVTVPSSSDEGQVHIRVAVPEAEFDKSISVSAGTTGLVQLPPTAMGEGTGPQRGTVRVEAASLVSIQVMVNVGGTSSEAFLALPLESLGMEYIASSTSPAPHHPNKDSRSLATLAIAGVCDGTSVSIKAARPLTYSGVIYKTGRTLRVTLDSEKSIQIQSDGEIAGTRVTSDKPIAVVLANTCPADVDDNHCDYVVEQLPPVYALGKHFLLVAQLAVDVEANVGELFVLAARGGTTVEIPGLGLSRRLDRGKQWQLPRDQTSRPLFLVADKPVQVTLYSPAVSGTDCLPQQQSCDSRSRTMTVIPPLEQFTDRTDIALFNMSAMSPQANKRETENFLTVLTTVACDDVASGLIVTSDQSRNVTWVKEGILNKSGTCVLRAEVPPGIIQMNAELLGTSDVRFAVLLYGVYGRLTYSMPAMVSGSHLGYISREIERHECTMESFDPCEVNPCMNSGDCIREGDGFQCSCISPFYEGLLCETRVDPCSLRVSLCFNGGTCAPDRECLCPRGWGGKHCEFDVNAHTTSSRGREFILTFMEHKTPRRSPSIVVSTGDISTSATTVNVNVPVAGFMKTVSIPPNQVQVIEIPTEAISVGSRQQNSGVEVSASQDISVVGFHNSIAPGDGFLALPMHALGTRHHVIAARQRKKRPAEKSQIAIVAAADNTTVFIRTYVPVIFQGQPYAAYSSIISHLQRLEVVQLQSQFDLTRAEISSDRPVAVLSGSTCGYTMYEGTDQKSCSFMVEQLLPMRSWGKRFVVSPFLGNTNGQTTVRIIGGPKETHVTDGRYKSAYLWDGSMHETYTTQPMYISATHPVLVVAFSVQASSDCSDEASDCQVASVPTMSVIPSLDQFTASATFATPSAVNTYSVRYKNYINIITSNCSDIRLSPLSSRHKEQAEWDTSVKVPFTDLCLVGKEIQPGQYQVSSESGQVTFSAQLYGFNNYGSAYGIPLPQSGLPAEEFGESPFRTSGTEFVLAFISGGNYSPIEGPRLLITATTNATQTKVMVSGNGLDVALTLEPNEVQVVDVPPTLIGISGHDPYPNIAIQVRSSHDIAVYGMNDAYGTGEGYDTVSDGYQAFPVQVLGREYALVTSWPVYQQYPDRYMQFFIIGLHDSTRVDIELNGAVWFDGTLFYGGERITIVLSKHRVAYFKSYNDHTGSHVMSTKPVAVISGTDCGFSPRYPSDGPLDYPCDHQVEFMTPATRWGKTFILAPLQGYRGGDIYVRIQALHYFATVTFGSGATAREFEAFDSPLSFSVGGQGIVNQTLVESNMPVSVAAFVIYQPLLHCLNENGSCEGHSRPVLFTVPPVESFKKKLTFPSYRVRDADNMANYADVYTKCAEAEFVLVNGAAQSWDYPLEEIDESGYCVLRLRLASDEIATSYVVESSLEDGRLGAITYGFSDRSGYAFPGGI